MDCETFYLIKFMMIALLLIMVFIMIASVYFKQYLAGILFMLIAIFLEINVIGIMIFDHST